MSRHVSYRGVTIDMDSLRRENEKAPAIGNMKVNAKGDQIANGQIVKTVDQLARENHNVQRMVVNSGLKGKQPDAKNIGVDSIIPKPTATAEPAKPAAKPVHKKTKEKELPSGDIVVEDDNEA